MYQELPSVSGNCLVRDIQVLRDSDHHVPAVSLCLSRAPCLGKKKPPARPEPKKDFRNSAASSLHNTGFAGGSGYESTSMESGLLGVQCALHGHRPQGLYMSLPFLKPKL